MWESEAVLHEKMQPCGDVNFGRADPKGLSGCFAVRGGKNSVKMAPRSRTIGSLRGD